MRTALIAGMAAAGLAAAGLLAFAGQEGEGPKGAGIEIMGRPAGPEILALGEAVYAETCASCHGTELEGQPDWKRRLENGRMPAPPHDETGHTWHHADADLFRLTKEGVAAVIGGSYESDMPAFGLVLSDEEILAALAFIKSTWPERQRDYQTQINRQQAQGDGS